MPVTVYAYHGTMKENVILVMRRVNYREWPRTLTGEAKGGNGVFLMETLSLSVYDVSLMYDFDDLQYLLLSLVLSLCTLNPKPIHA